MIAKCAVVSAIIHFLVIAVLAGTSLSNPTIGPGRDGLGNGSTGPKVSISIIDKSQKPETTNSAAKECTNWYGGIGLITQGIGEVIHVANGYAAHNADIRVGDILITSSSEIIGDPGGKVVVRFARGGVVYTLTLTRERICLNE